jgi:hypothetical protein
VVVTARISEAADAPTADPLAPIRQTLRHMSERPDIPALHGLASGLTVRDRRGWVPATDVVSGLFLDDLLDAARRRWGAAPHAAAALAWKCYAYWLSLPAVLGYATARRVPLVRPESVLVRWSPTQPFLRIGLTNVEVAVLPNDPILLNGRRKGIRVVAHDNALLDELRSAVMDEHLTPILGHLRRRLHLGRRTLWGSLASGVAHGLSRAADVIPGPTLTTAVQVLDALGIDDLVELGPRSGGGLTVSRRTCCLAFTLPEPHRKVCAGCCIH